VANATVIFINKQAVIIRTDGTSMTTRDGSIVEPYTYHAMETKHVSSYTFLQILIRIQNNAQISGQLFMNLLPFIDKIPLD
jgi:hypothetical protein